MRTTAAVLSLSLLSAGAAFAAATPSVSSAGDATATPVASSQYRAQARIWVANDRDYFRSGDRLRVNFSTSEDAYVAVVHVDPDGYLDFVYPRSPWDSEFVRAGRTHAIDGNGWSNELMVRGRGGVGYLYVVASPVPLDYSQFRGRAGSGWDWSYAGRSVSGDPFWAMEQITRLLLPRWSNVPYAVDYYSYYLDGPQRYPSYACANRGFDNGLGWGYHTGWSSYYGSCDRLSLFLRDNPYYFDARRYRGDRRSYYTSYRDWDPRHGFKTDPRAAQVRPGARVQTPNAAQQGPRATTPQTGVTAPTNRPAQRAEPASQPAGRALAPRQPERQPAASPPAAQPRTRATPAPVQRQPARADPAPVQRQPTRATPAPETRRPAATPRPAERQPARAAEPQRPTPTRSAAPAPRGSSDAGSSSSSPSSRRGGD